MYNARAIGHWPPGLVFLRLALIQGKKNPKILIKSYKVTKMGIFPQQKLGSLWNFKKLKLILNIYRKNSTLNKLHVAYNI